jgi:hypothetical protein
VVRRAQALAVVLLLTAGLCTITGTVAPAPDAAAATVNIGTIQAQLSNHRGVNNGTSGNCITYAPVGTSTSSALVSSPSEAQTAHGRPSNSPSSCPSTLNSSTQSTVGFRPAATTSAQDGVAFPIGKMIHYNNPVYADDRYFTGRISAILGGFTSPNTVGFDWQLDETPNSGGNNCCNDLITFTNQISTVTLTQGGLNFRLVILGFIPVASSTTTCDVPGHAERHPTERVQHGRGRADTRLPVRVAGSGAHPDGRQDGHRYHTTRALVRFLVLVDVGRLPVVERHLLAHHRRIGDTVADQRQHGDGDGDRSG